MTVAQFANSSGQLGFFPPGAMVMMTFKSGKAPSGWVPCDGRLLLQEQYSALFAAIGTRYNTGAEPVGYFRLPNSVTDARHLRGAPNIALPASAVTGGSSNHSHEWTSSVSFALTASGSHGHNLNGNINTVAADPFGSHGHGNAASTSTGTSSSNHNKGNGSRQVAIATHSHAFFSVPLAANHVHGHNHNASNTSINANANHESLHYVTATNNAISVSAPHNLATFRSTLMIKI